jgi:REP element-mobilizing transposase RayT
MPYTRIAIHAMWSTKYRKKIITQELKPILLSHIKENAKEKNILLDTINCVQDHIHILFFLLPNQKLSDVLQLIKGESSFWVNRNKLIKTKFEWQDEYIALSVSESVVPKVRNYIVNQEEHHRKKKFMDEYNQFIDKYGFKNNSG